MHFSLSFVSWAVPWARSQHLDTLYYPPVRYSETETTSEPYIGRPNKITSGLSSTRYNTVHRSNHQRQVTTMRRISSKAMMARKM
ncbi:hypothetical protein F4778DRAFT_724743 [Xylariomycetidae sp. FL2044]|nr:hypothetical protein F4778DRAFT_724743 [Xylariomycetidae sp. FL2044]